MAEIPESWKKASGLDDGPPDSIIQYGPVKNADPQCPACGGSGIVDSGGILPWGEPAMVMCGCVHGKDMSSFTAKKLTVESQPMRSTVAVWKSLRNGGYEVPVDRALEIYEALEARIRELEQERDRAKDSHFDAINDLTTQHSIEWHAERKTVTELQAQLQAVTQERDALTTELSRHAAIYERLGAQLQARNRDLETKNEILEDKLLAARKP